MFFSDRDILDQIADGEIHIEPFEHTRVQPASYDLSLGDHLVVYEQHTGGRAIDPRVSSEELCYPLLLNSEPNKAFQLRQGQFVLGMTAERIALSNTVVAQLNGKSSLGRLGLVVHSTAGFVDPGWKGNLTLELSNVNPTPIKLYPGMLIAQLVFSPLKTAAQNPYGSKERPGKYQGDRVVRVSRSYMDLPNESA